MPGNTTSVFSKPDDYQAALQRDGECTVVVSGRGRFQAELTRIELLRMRLVAGTENLARIGFISVPVELVRIVLPLRRDGKLTTDSLALRIGEIGTQGPGQRIHERTDGPCLWRAIWLPASDLLRYGRAVTGASFAIPMGSRRWRPPPDALARLNHLHDDATRMSKTQPHVLTGAEAMRGLEQELIDAVIECLRWETSSVEAAAAARHSDIMSRFEDVLRSYPDRAPSIRDICATLAVSDRSLRACCAMYLGMGPHRYLRLRQMQLARRALHSAGPGAMRVSDIAQRYGFGGAGRFAAAYCEQFGELPSATKARRTAERCATGY